LIDEKKPTETHYSNNSLSLTSTNTALFMRKKTCLEVFDGNVMT
jgi:hypothetical protein